MEEIRAVRGSSGLKFVSTFSGCGGSCLGFEMAGFEPLYACEFIDEARATYQANHHSVFVDGRDIRLVKPEEVLERIGMKPGELDVLEGSPPCSSFSMAGKRSAGWGEVKKYSDKEQRTDDLFFEFIRLLTAIKPRVFVAENVMGLVSGTAKGYFKIILRSMDEAGYDVEAAALDAQWLGVPQARRRIIFVGVRKDLQRKPAFPEPLPYRYSIRDAIGDLVGGQIAQIRTRTGSATTPNGPSFQWEDWSPDRPIGTIRTSTGNATILVAPEGDGPSMKAYAVGREWNKLRQGEQSKRYFNLVRPNMRMPMPTMTAIGGSSPGVASVTHPSEPRKFTIAELRRLCGFPDDFILTGTYAQQWERLGRAVPPPMMMHVARSLIGILS